MRPSIIHSTSSSPTNPTILTKPSPPTIPTPLTIVDEYDWGAETDVHIELTESAQFTAVYRVNRTNVTLYRRDTFGGREPLSASAFRYRYPNGTVITGSEFDEHGGDVTKSRDEITVVFPTDGPTDGCHG